MSGILRTRAKGPDRRLLSHLPFSPRRPLSTPCLAHTRAKIFTSKVLTPPTAPQLPRIRQPIMCLPRPPFPLRQQCTHCHPQVLLRQIVAISAPSLMPQLPHLPVPCPSAPTSPTPPHVLLQQIVDISPPFLAPRLPPLPAPHMYPLIFLTPLRLRRTRRSPQPLR